MRGVFYLNWPPKIRGALAAVLAGVFLVMALFWAALGGEQTAETSSRSVMNTVIVIDAGHGGEDPGAEANGVLEKDIDLKISLYLKKILEQGGSKVYITRTTDVDLGGNSPDLEVRKMKDLDSRIGLAHRKKAQIFLSIHANSFPGAGERGAQVFFQEKQPESKKLAEAIQAELIRLLQNTEREALEADIYTNRVSKMASVTVEVGFLSNPDEAALLKDPIYQQKVAFAIYSGIIKFFSGGR